MTVEIAKKEDSEGLLRLYTQLHDNPLPDIDDGIKKLWDDISEDKNHFVFVMKDGGKILSSCVEVIVPNLTHAQRPYAIIENVITDEKCRNKGYATKILSAAKEKAKEMNCYKMMLMTGSKEESTLGFYEKNGYNSQDKTAFVQWL